MQMMLLVFVYVTMVNRAATGQETDTGLMDEIRSVWGARAKSYETARFQWKSEWVIFALNGETLPEPVPQKNISFYTLAGESGHQLDQWEAYSSESGKSTPGEHINVYHEDRGRYYSAKGNRGWITKENVLMRHSQEAKLVLGWFFEEPAFLYNERYEVLRVQGEIGSRIVVVGNTDFNDPNLRGATRAEFEYSEELGWAVRSQRHMLPDGQIVVEGIFEYKEDESRRGIPDKLTFNNYSKRDPSVLKSHGEMTIEELEINIPVDRSIFELEFPSGTGVYDDILQLNYTVGSVGDINLDLYLDQTLDDLNTDNERPRGDGAEEVHETAEQGSVDQPDATAGDRPWLLIGIAVLVALAGAFGFSMYRRRS